MAAELVDRRRWGGFGPGFDRPGYSRALANVLVDHGVDLVVMAGFGTVLERPVHDAFPHRLLNTHPALLPAFPGWHAVEEALAAGVAVTGCTVHLAELQMDTGPVLAQQEVPVEAGDTVDSLHERIKAVEWWLYPASVRRVLRAMRLGVAPESLPALRGTVDRPLDPTSAGLGAADPTAGGTPAGAADLTAGGMPPGAADPTAGGTPAGAADLIEPLQGRTR